MDTSAPPQKEAGDRARSTSKRGVETPEERELRLAKQRAYGATYRKRHGEKERERHRKAALAAYHADPENGRQRLAASRAKHGEKWTADRRARRAIDPEPNRKWQRERYANRAEVREARAAQSKVRYAEKKSELYALALIRHRERYQSDHQYVMARRVRVRLTNALRRYRVRKSDFTFDLVGCSIRHLLDHIESLFSEGMSWGNRANWHIDHIRPIYTFDLTDPEQQRICFHYTNLRPLWAEQNLTRPRPRVVRRELPNSDR